ncbi:MAG: GTPase ObgE, partial [Clostridia bacterium]|nr:GTPase ObgE [Clostridia bacterium]
VIDEGTNTLLNFRYHRKFVAKNGENGRGGKMHGATADDLIIPVPAGTIIRDAQTGAIIKDMSDSEPFVCLKGGNGGWGNRHFATPTRQIPRFAKSGLRGKDMEVILELKMLADVGFVGLPNVGKSSILSMISAAKPKIANYHFTTLSPVLGVVSTGGEGGGFVAADIPGLIEGASEGLGLGHDFLRHVDRCRLLLHVVDVAGSEGRDPIEDIEMINAELAQYSENLAARPQIIVANKRDLVPEDYDLSAFEEYVASLGYPLIYVSAATGENLKQMVYLAADMLKDLPPLTIYEADYVEPAPAVEPGDHSINLRREGNVWYVEADWLYNLVGSVNFEDRESLRYFDRVLRTSGVFDKMRAGGVKDGDSVNMYDFEFDFVE